MQIVIVLGLLVIAVVLFASEIIPVDLITILLLISLVLTGILNPSEAFSGFSNEIIIILASIFVVSGALQKTGVVQAIGVFLLRVAGSSPSRLIAAIMTTVGGVSAFMNNTTAAAVFLPPVMGLSKKAKVSPSKLLMPLAFGSILGGTCTVVGTSSNVAVSGFLVKAGMKPVTLFETSALGVVLLMTGIIYMVLVGQHLLPSHKGESKTDDYAIREYLSEITITDGSHLIGQKVFESDLSKMDLRIIEILRASQGIVPDPETAVQEGDVLLVEARMEDLMLVREEVGIEIRAASKFHDSDLEYGGMRIVEALIMPQSTLVDRTLKEVNFRQRYGLSALAIYRKGHSLRGKIGRILLRVGDVLLIQGPLDRLPALRNDPDLWILEELDVPLSRKRSGLYAVMAFLAAVILAATGWVPLSVAFLSAGALTILIRCITVEEAYKFIDWRLIIMIGGMTAFGEAMDKSGAAGFLAHWIVQLLQPFGVTAVLGGFLCLTLMLTQPMSNAAAALVVLPVALLTAQQLHVNARSFAIAIMLTASISLIAPFEPACILVYGLGKYRFVDFVKTGLGITIILTLIVLLAVPILWPLAPATGIVSP